jgi:glutamate-1-semialdehyde 2,1-aminomutase
MPVLDVAELHRIMPGACFGANALPDELVDVVSHGRGSRIWTADGREYVDYVLGSGPLVLGHADPRVVAATSEQVERGLTFYALTEPALALVRRIVELVPCAEAVKLVTTGSEATFYALRIARAATGREKVIKFEGAYHGHNDYAMHGHRPSPPRAFPEAAPDTAGIPAAVSETVLVAPYNDLDAVHRIAADAAADLAAIVVEPFQGALEPRPGFLEGLREIADRHGAMLVFDEVLSGFRVAPGGAQELTGVRPDLCALGKIIGGGLPLAAVAGRRDALALTVPGADPYAYLSGTLNGSPVAAAAGLATLEGWLEDGGPAIVAANAARLKEGIEASAAAVGIDVQVLGRGGVAEAVFTATEVTDYRTYAAADRSAASRFGTYLLRHGINIRPGGRFFISSAHSDADIDQTLDVAAAALAQIATANAA